MDADADAGAQSTPPPPLVKIVALILLQGAVFTALGAGLWAWSGRPVDAFVTITLREVAWGLALGAGFIALAAALFYGFPRVSVRLVHLQRDTYAFLGPKLGWVAIVLISLAAGIGEEALLRGGLQTALNDWLGPWGAIAVASAAFAVLHLAKPLITVLLFAIGVIFGVVYWQTGSLLTVMIGHAVYDVWALRYLHREFVRLGLVEAEPPG
ncbi:CPBP family intramembrane glutamic endopeptidase [Qipengyuania sediminis]|uniref:CPBP family intramembrane glutamic endopeptidase n=1 Tax=Qipengyuania sediminis TaxID=1532023 RepID=UPI001059EAB2|nr:type II CAAX endopeptidase family protein [Qipengyuania sediminis]